jgi:predicted Zn-dependent protease
MKRFSAFLLGVSAAVTMSALASVAGPTGPSAWETEQDNQAYQAEQPMLVSMQSRQGRIVASIAAQIEPVVRRMYGAPVRYYLTNEQDPNAYSFYGPRVYISEGMVRLAQNREELSGILCHESAHVIHHDGRNSAVAQHDHNLRVDALLSHHHAMFAHLLSMGDNAVQLHFSRGQELHADRTGASICSASGINPWGLVWMLQHLQASADFRTGHFAYFSDHPTNQARIKALIELIESKAQFKVWRSKHSLQYATSL